MRTDPLITFSLLSVASQDVMEGQIALWAWKTPGITSEYALEKYGEWLTQKCPFSVASKWGERLIDCAGLRRRLRHAGREGRMDRWIDDVKERIRLLAAGESLLVPGGCLFRVPASEEAGGGHALLYQVTREKTHSYTLTLFNTGLGLRHHPHQTVKGSVRYQTHLSKGELSSGEINAFFDKVCPLASQHDVHLEEGATVATQALKEIDQIYHDFQALTGKERNETALYRTPQRGHSCSKEMIDALMARELDRPLYKTVQLFLKRHFAHLAWESLSQQSHLSLDERAAIKDTLKKALVRYSAKVVNP